MKTPTTFLKFHPDLHKPDARLTYRDGAYRMPDGKAITPEKLAELRKAGGAAIHLVSDSTSDHEAFHKRMEELGFKEGTYYADGVPSTHQMPAEAAREAWDTLTEGILAQAGLDPDGEQVFQEMLEKITEMRASIYKQHYIE